jgi:hypothetical protein
MIDLFNSSSSARYIRAYRIYMFNNGTTSVTGVLTNIQVRRSSASSGGTSITPIAHNLGNSALDANTTAGTGRTVTSSSVFRQVLYQNDEPAVTTLDMDALLTLVPFAEIWNAGYGDSNVEPIVCRAGQNEGVCVFQPGANAVGSCDLEIEFTDSAS